MVHCSSCNNIPIFMNTAPETPFQVRRIENNNNCGPPHSHQERRQNEYWRLQKRWHRDFCGSRKIVNQPPEQATMVTAFLRPWQTTLTTTKAQRGPQHIWGPTGEPFCHSHGVGETRVDFGRWLVIGLCVVPPLSK